MKLIRLILLLCLIALTLGASTYIPIVSFNGGYFSPYMEARSDFPKYQSSCRILENFLITAQGPVTKRPGTKYVATSAETQDVSRLIPFEYSTDDTYILEFVDNKLYFYRNGAQILDGSDDPYFITTVFDANEIPSIQYAQSDNEMYLVDGTDIPQVLTRISHNEWTISNANLTTGPFMAQNTDARVTITPPSPVSDITSGRTYASSSDYSASYAAAKAFNDIYLTFDGWISLSGTVANQWLRVDFTAGDTKVVKKIRIYPLQNDGLPTAGPRYAKLEASADAVTWTKIPASAWPVRCLPYNTDEFEIKKVSSYSQYAEIEFTNTTAYRYYRVFFYNNWGYSVYVSCNEIEMFTAPSSTYTASADLWNEDHVGSLWQVIQERGTSVLTGNLTSATTSANSVFFKGGYSFTTTGTWVGTLVLQRSTDNGLSWSSALSPLTSTNFDNTGETESEGAIYRVNMTAYTSGTCTYTLTISDTKHRAVIRVTGYTSPTSVTATSIVPPLNNTATAQWREGYWSDYRGWPKSVCFHQQRLVLGGSESFPQTLWFGKQDPDNFTDFEEGTTDTDPFTPVLPGQNPIRWILSGDYLFIGTSGSTGYYGEKGKAITPTSPNYSQQSVGVANIGAATANDTILYVERGSRKVREFQFSLPADKYLSSDLTLLAEDITESGIKEIAFQQRPIPTLWCVLNNGDIATMTYQKDQSVIGWALQTTDGDFESVATIPGTTEDEVWVTVKRTIGGTDYRFIEQFQPMDWGTDTDDCWFVDCGLDGDSLTGTGSTTWAGLDHLIGETVSVYADSVVLGDEVVDGDPAGQIIIASAATKLTAGLPYTAKLETAPLTFDLRDAALDKKILRLWVDLYQTGDLKYGLGANSTLTEINFNNTISTSDVKLEKYGFPYGIRGKATIYLESSKPAPVTIRRIQPELEPIKID